MPSAPGSLVSVVIPCYNQAHFIADAIESALTQTYTPVEVIVVDDGGTDDTAAVVGRYPVRYLRQTNGGVAAARNTGIRASLGLYVVCLDGDDRLLPHALQTGVMAIDTHPECAFVFGRHRRVGPTLTPLPTPERRRLERDHYLGLLRTNYIANPAAVMYRRSIFDVVRGFDVASSPSCDYDIYLRIARRFPIFDHYEVVAEYRQHDRNVTHNAALMLSATLAVVRAQRPPVGAAREHRDAYEAALRGAAGYYEALIANVGDDVAHGEWGRALRGVLTAARYFPRWPGRALAKVAAPARRAVA